MSIKNTHTTSEWAFTTKPAVGTSVYLPLNPTPATFVDMEGCAAFPAISELTKRLTDNGNLYGVVIKNPSNESLSDDEVVVRWGFSNRVLAVFQTLNEWRYLEVDLRNNKNTEDVEQLHVNAFKAVIFDLDGTLSDNNHRLHFITNGIRQDWDSYTSHCVFDAPNRSIIKLYKQYQCEGKKILILTGRCESVRDQTVAWLSGAGLSCSSDLNNLDQGYRLHMRPEGNRKRDADLKKEWVNAYIKAGAITPSTTLAYDDLAHNIEMFEELGILSYLVGGDNHV